MRTEVPAVLDALGPMGSGSALGFASLARNDGRMGGAWLAAEPT